MAQSDPCVTSPALDCRHEYPGSAQELRKKNQTLQASKHRVRCKLAEGASA